MHRILIVDDDCDLANITEVYLRHCGYEADKAFSASQALACIENTQYDLILLDVMLPDGMGDSICSDIRERHACPIIFLSCVDDSFTIISALRKGGDDYVVKPIKYGELLARIQANIRRYELQNKAPGKDNIRTFRHFSVDTLRRKLFLEDKEIELSAIEYALLICLIDNPNTLLLYDELYNAVWKHDSFGDVRTVMVHISNLRKKIDPARHGIIETVRGAGYIFSNV